MQLGRQKQLTFLETVPHITDSEWI